MKRVKKYPQRRALEWGFEAYVELMEERNGPFYTGSNARLWIGLEFYPEANSFQTDPTNRKCCRTELKIAAYITGCPGQHASRLKGDRQLRPPEGVER